MVGSWFIIRPRQSNNLYLYDQLVVVYSILLLHHVYMNKIDAIKKAAQATLPTFFAYFPLGMVFAVLFTHAGFDWYLAPLMSAVVYAGAVQFVALSMMIDHASLAAILFGSLFIALRNSFYGLALIDRFKPYTGLKRFFLIFGLVDATYAILASWPRQKDDDAFCFYTTLFPYLSWVGGSLFGALLADSIPVIQGMDFILACFFMVLVVEYYLASKQKDALLVPVLASVFAFFILPEYQLLIAIMTCVIYLYMTIKVVEHE